jgi:cyclophilin family peptidyl-prolyl cis-trans isomerase
MRPFLAPLFLLATVCASACAAPAPVPATRSAAAATAAQPPKEAAAAPAPDLTEATVVLETAVGDIVLKLFPEDAPKTVANFVKLVGDGFYDGLTFHRVVPGFVIQGGDPNSRDENPFNDGQGSPGYTVPAEFKRKHVRGAVATARMPDVVNPKRESNGSQFYIALRDLPSLDGGYTVFAQVVSGWDTIDRIVALADRKDIARQGDNANPGKLALIKHARLVLHAKPKPAAAADSTQR